MRIVTGCSSSAWCCSVSGIGFVIASARTPQVEAAAPPAPSLPPVATVKQIMTGIVTPAAYVVFDSVTTIVDAKGVQENQPRTDEEWARVGASAAVLVESANLLLIGNRAVDQGDWVKMSQAMADAGQMALKAADSEEARRHPRGRRSDQHVMRQLSPKVSALALASLVRVCCRRRSRRTACRARTPCICRGSTVRPSGR